MGLPAAILLEIVSFSTVLGMLQMALTEALGTGPAPIIAPVSYDASSTVAAAPAAGRDFAWISSGVWSVMERPKSASIVCHMLARPNRCNRASTDRRGVPFIQLTRAGDADNGLTSLPRPGLHRQLAMIALRQNVRQPDRPDPAPVQPFLLSMPSQAAIHDLRWPQTAASRQAAAESRQYVR